MKDGTARDRVARWLAGGCLPEDDQHVLHCEKCSQELRRMEMALFGFRQEVRSWTSRQPGASAPVSAGFEQARRARTAHRTRWTLATAAAVAMVLAPVWKTVRDGQREAEGDRADAALLERVDYHISQPAPGPLAPIERLFVAEETRYSQDSGNEDDIMKGEELR